MNEEFCMDCGRELAMNGYEKLIKELADERDQFRFEVNRLRAERRWIPVKDRLPWKGHCILALDERSVINITFRMDDQWAGVNPNIAITHWMPLPEAPEALP